MTTVITKYKTYRVLESYDKVKNIILEYEQVALGTGWMELHVRPEGRSIGEVPVNIDIRSVEAVEYE